MTPRASRAEIIHITGTDTGVGKTVFTALLLHDLRQQGVHALAMKPFCSGGREDAKLLWEMQDREGSLDDLNPYHFREPLTPLLAARKERKHVPLGEVAAKILGRSAQCEVLLVEGAGGLLSPLGEDYAGLEVIRGTGGMVVAVGPNRLGAFNQMRLTTLALQIAGMQRIALVLMGQKRPDKSTLTNAALLRELAGFPVVEIGYGGKNASEKAGLKLFYKKVKKPLARWRKFVSLLPRSTRTARRKRL
ncbi:MAG: dethiobiotin synthase [Verrucomicrobiota bacterium]